MKRHSRIADLARVAFVLACLGFAAWGFDGRWPDLKDALSQVGPERMLLALLFTLVGLRLSGELWLRCMNWTGHELSRSEAAAVFFVGQLGKYIPGSVWNLAVQAQAARQYGVPPRASVSASMTFLLVHTASGAAIGSFFAGIGLVGLSGPSWPWLIVTLGCAASMLPVVIRRIGQRIAGPAATVSVNGAEMFRALATMAGVWTLYGAALLWAFPHPTTSDLLLAVAVFAASHAVGVVVVIAPAGLGAREAIAVTLLTPTLGFASAASAALLIRVIHTAADLCLAAVAWLGARRNRATAR